MKKIFLFMMCILVPAAVYSAERFSLEGYASRFDSIPIGVVNFRSTTGQTIRQNMPWEVIANNFDFCGKFNVVKSSVFDSTLFAENDVAIYVDGEYTIEGNNITIVCNLRDVATRSLILGKRYSGEVKHIRNMVHRYSNEVVEALFGDKGFFESRILYIRMEGTKRNVAIMDFDGFNRVGVTNNDVINMCPTFVNKSTALWTSYLRGKPDIYRGSISGGKSQLFISGRTLLVSPDVSPIDGSIAYASSQAGKLDIYVCNADGSNPRRLTFGNGVSTSPNWSPNGYQIAFMSDRTGGPQIYIMDAYGANQRRVTFEGRYNAEPAWSPRGDKIAYASVAQGYRFDIWVVSPDGSGAKKLTDMPGSSEYPTWSPDGSLIAFINTQNGRSDLYVIKPDGTRLRRVTTTGDVKMPKWSRHF